MHHHPRNQERAINLSILAVSGPEALVSRKLPGVSFLKQHRIAGWHSLRSELRRYLIAFEPLTLFLVNENILGKCFRSSSSCDGPRISPLASQYECPRLFLSIITSGTENKHNRTEVLLHYSIHPCAGYRPALSTSVSSR
ncbi:hypothetical protein NPIL_163541 [Nephila pilipes]|uniref:Uncharacterized protein n=1 Tax=Nephila pilipes TaxID=299642 RepID=A0A8X6T2H0_NEPPI|nr:hypothetical protein NPIL_163541 [Nephila pilipes]